jgi:MFS family permease
MQAQNPVLRDRGPGELSPPRTQTQAALATAGMAVLGPAAGSALAAVMLVDSGWSQALGFFALPLVFGFGYKIWMARLAAVAWDHLVSGWVRALWQILVQRRRPQAKDVVPSRETLAAMADAALRATSVFGRVGLYFGALMGALAALAALPGLALVSGGTFFAASAAYGFALARMGRAGWLVFPESF